MEYLDFVSLPQKQLKAVPRFVTTMEIRVKISGGGMMYEILIRFIRKNYEV